MTNTSKALTRLALRLLLLILLVVGAYLFWYTHRPLPNPTEALLFTGVTYVRQIRPGPIIVHVVRIDLDTPGLRFFTTPYTPTDGHNFAAKTVSQFLDEFDLQLAINGDFFEPWRDNGIFDYFPNVGDGVDVRGLAISDGQVVSQGYAPPEHTAVVTITSDNRVSFNQPSDATHTAIAGNMMLLQEGEALPIDTLNDYLAQPHPRTVIALDESGRTLLLIVVDGRQSNYSEGATIPELNQIILEYSGYTALNLDGGGSSTLVSENAAGNPVILNSPIHNRIPGRERPIANHLGVYVDRTR